MNEPRFDCWARTLSGAASRRQTIFASFLGGFSLLRGDREAVAKKRRKRKRRNKIKRNAFGCVNVGGFCKNDGQCCSGICQGKKGKNLHLQKCQAHDTGGCQGEPDQDRCLDVKVNCVTGIGIDGFCVRTTGNAGYCEATLGCFACTKDADCGPFCGAQSACIVCVGCEETGDTACVGPANNSCSFPV